jgi:hypothetical protein
MFEFSYLDLRLRLFSLDLKNWSPLILNLSYYLNYNYSESKLELS